MPWNWLPWWHTPRLDHWRVRLYTRQGCHLCDEAWQRLTQARRRHGFTLDAVDIDTDAELLAQYGEAVPVVAVNGKVRFRGVVNPVLLERLFSRAEAGDGTDEEAVTN